MILNLNRGAFGLTSFDFAGDVDFARSGSDWMLAILTTGSGGGRFYLKRTIVLADVCLVAGGKPGVAGASSDGCTGGAGGGVYTPTPRLLPPGEYTVQIGGSGEDTTLTLPDGTVWSAVSGQGKAGGTGSSGSGINGGDGDYAWNDANTVLRAGWRYGAGGGRGKYDTDYSSYPSGAGGSVGSANEGAAAGSPEAMAGHGGNSDQSAGWAGLANTGQGGGGGRYRYGAQVTTITAAGGAGGSGVILIRPHKEVAA